LASELLVESKGHQSLPSRMGCSSSNILTHANIRAVAVSSRKQPKTVLKAYEIPVTPVLCASDQIDLEESNAWETCSCASWENRKQQVVGDKRVPLPPSSRMHQKHKKRLDQFFEQVVVRQDDFKQQVERRRSKLDAAFREDQNFTEVATSIVPIKVDPQKKYQDFSAMDCHGTPACRSETLPGCLEF